MEITSTEYKRCDYVKAKGRIDSITATELEETFNQILQAGKSGIVFDMNDVDFIASRGIWVLIDTQKTLKRKKGKLVLVNIPEDMKRPLLDYAGVKFFFEVYDDVTEAVGSF
ncbi:MAG: STAS domain-containing protein [Anaerolineales bacterium]|jgi:anti-sigma B factor antagonist